MPKNSQTLFVSLFILASLTGCDENQNTTESEGETINNGTPVTLTSVTIGPMEEKIELNATSTFQLRSYIKANATGYLQTVNAKIGEPVWKGQEVFTLTTKEAKALGKTISSLDSSLQFSGIVHIKSPGNGYVTALNYKAGDYVQDGEQLATISDKNSFVFLLDLPYELTPFLSMNQNLQLSLPDGTKVNGHVTSSMPIVDPTSQTQSIVIKPKADRKIPEGLIAKALFIRKTKSNVTSLPKEAVLANEVQDSFWVMKLIDNSTAVKVPIVKGMETGSQVEILFPEFTKEDQILLTGNYGLPDTAKIVVQKEQ